MITTKPIMEGNTTIKMFDHLNKEYVEIRHTENGWERWASKTKSRWDKIAVFKTMDSALKYKNEVINNNFTHLYNLIKNKR